MQFPPCFLSQLHSSTHTTGLFLCTKCILRTDRRMKPVLLKVLRSPLWRSLRSTVKKYVVLSLKSGRNLYIHETPAELLGEGCSDAGSLINKQIHVSYLRRDTFENDGRILLSLRIAGEDWITLKDTTNAFREHIKAPIYTVALTIAVLWVSYLSICVFFRRAKIYETSSQTHKKSAEKQASSGRLIQSPPRRHAFQCTIRKIVKTPHKGNRAPSISSHGLSYLFSPRHRL